MKFFIKRFFRACMAVLAALCFGFALPAEAVYIDCVGATQNWPYDGKLAIRYEVIGDIQSEILGSGPARLLVEAYDVERRVQHEALPEFLSGDLSMGPGIHDLVWDIGAQGISIASADVTIGVSYVVDETPPLYCKIDLRGGPDARSYPVEFGSYEQLMSTLNNYPHETDHDLDIYPNTLGWTMDAKNDFLILRYIEPGTFTVYSETTPKTIRISHPFWLGVFEVTQGQYELVMGERYNRSVHKRAPTDNNMHEHRPVENVTYSEANEFLEKLSKKTSLSFNLPTEAQWEYAATDSINWSANYAACYRDNHQLRHNSPTSFYYYQYGFFTNAHNAVGGYVPTRRGLFDMRGNVRELCRDYYEIYPYVGGTCDPLGPAEGTQRVCRGGSWNDSESSCDVDSRVAMTTDKDEYTGFRACAFFSYPRSYCSGDDFGVSVGVQVVKTPIVHGESPFFTAKQQVEITCATPGAIIRYTMDNTTPTARSPLYTGPITVTNSCYIRAIAYHTDPSYRTSKIAYFPITKRTDLAITLGLQGYTVFREGKGFKVVFNETFPTEGAAQSMPLTHNEYAEMYTTITGRGILSFKWRASCEKDDAGTFSWDHGEFIVDRSVRLRIDGVTDWTTVNYPINTLGDHTIAWKYVKDDMDEEGLNVEDCIWVTDVKWMPEGFTETTDVPVPYAWLREKCPGVGSKPAHYEAEAKKKAANGVNTVEQCYIAGFDPADPAAQLKALISSTGNDVRISWTPNLNTGAVTRIYRVQGRQDLATGAWVTPANSSHRFFKVSVEMPTGAPGESSAVADAPLAPAD